LPLQESPGWKPDALRAAGSRSEELLAVSPVLWRRAARTGETGAVAVLQTGEGANRVGVGGTQALTPDGLAVAAIFRREAPERAALESP